MSTVALSPSEDQVFAAVYAAIVQLFDTSIQPNIFKGFQNMTSTPLASYIVISPSTKERQNQGARSYDATNGLMNEERSTTYSYQIDCYGPAGPDYADIISIAWRSAWFANYAEDNALPFQVLYADEPQQLNIANAENQYEQRFMLKIYLQVNQVVSLPQQFFATAPTITVEVPADADPL